MLPWILPAFNRARAPCKSWPLERHPLLHLAVGRIFNLQVAKFQRISLCHSNCNTEGGDDTAKICDLMLRAQIYMLYGICAWFAVNYFLDSDFLVFEGRVSRKSCCLGTTILQLPELCRTVVFLPTTKLVRHCTLVATSIMDRKVLGASYAPSCPQAEQQTEQQKDENG